MPVTLTVDSQVQDLAVGLVEATGIQIGAASEPLRQYAAQVAERVRQQGLRGGDERRTAVRRLLRAGGYRPAGRNKPAQEYLLRTIGEEPTLPSIWNAVDLINAVSLDSGLPISLVAIERTGSRMADSLWPRGRVLRLQSSRSGSRPRRVDLFMRWRCRASDPRGNPCQGLAAREGHGTRPPRVGLHLRSPQRHLRRGAARLESAAGRRVPALVRRLVLRQPAGPRRLVTGPALQGGTDAAR